MVFSISGFVMSVYMDRLLIPNFEKLLKISTQKAGTQRDLKTDIRDVQDKFKEVLEYDP